VTLAVAAFLSLSIGSTGITLSALPRVIAATITGQADAASTSACRGCCSVPSSARRWLSAAP